MPDRDFFTVATAPVVSTEFFLHTLAQTPRCPGTGFVVRSKNISGVPEAVHRGECEWSDLKVITVTHRKYTMHTTKTVRRGAVHTSPTSFAPKDNIAHPRGRSVSEGVVKFAGQFVEIYSSFETI